MSGLLTGAAVLGLSSSVVHAGRPGQGGAETGENTEKAYLSTSLESARRRNEKEKRDYLKDFDWQNSDAAVRLFPDKLFNRSHLGIVIMETCEMANDEKLSLSLKKRRKLILSSRACCYKFIQGNIDIFSAYRDCFALIGNSILEITPHDLRRI